ncbi:hypothetical protein IJ531_02820, partial [bacterium]|nr:hypothetical protein [bacterium]
KYEPLNKKEAVIIGLELVTMGAASFFAPGSDVGYFFIKGAIQRKKHPNWFKAGVYNAYDNSIFWFIEKGKPIDLAVNDEIKLKHLESTDAKNLSAKITYKKDKKAFRGEKKLVRAEVKEINKEYNKEQKLERYELAQNIKHDKKILKEHEKMARLMAQTVQKRAQYAAKIKVEK